MKDLWKLRELDDHIIAASPSSPKTTMKIPPLPQTILLKSRLEPPAEKPACWKKL